METKLLVADYVMFRLQKANLRWDDCPPLPRPGSVQLTMHAIGEAFEDRYTSVFQGMTDQLHLTPNSAYGTFMTIVNELFSDGIRWGRIVALIAFGGSFSVQCVIKEMPGLVDDVVSWVTDYIDNRLLSWIQLQGGWEEFVHFYQDRPDRRDESPWPRLSRVFGLAMSAVGLLTLGAFLSHRS